MDYKVEVRTRGGDLVDTMYKDGGLLIDFSWGYRRIGGCGKFTLRTKHGFSNLPPYSGGYDVRLKVENPLTGVYVLWYRGIIEQVQSTLGNIETSIITGFGYSIVLSRLTQNGSFVSTEISAIVKSLLDNTVLPNSDITYDSGDIEATGFTPDSITFNNRKISDCFETLSDLVGNYEWGVTSSLKFFFKARTAVSKIIASPGRNIIKFDWRLDYSRIVNRIIVEGGITGGSKFTRTINDTSSQLKWGLRERIVQNTAITTNQVADKYGNSILAEQATADRRASMTLFRNQNNTNENTPIESTLPMGTLEFRRGGGSKYGQKKYSQFLYGGPECLQISVVKYKMTDNGIMTDLSLGRYPPDLALTIKQIAFDISQNRQRSV